MVRCRQPCIPLILGRTGRPRHQGILNIFGLGHDSTTNQQVFQDELQSLTASESLLGLVPRFLRHFTLRLGAANPKRNSEALWELLKHAETQVVGREAGFWACF